MNSQLFIACSLLALLPTSVFANESNALTPTVVIGGKPVSFIVAPYLGPNGEIYTPVDAVKLLGATYIPNQSVSTVTVTAANGETKTVPYTLVQQRCCVALQPLLQALGATTQWQPTTQTLTVRAILEIVRQNGDTLSIYTSYPIFYQVKHWDNPARVSIDLQGVALSASPVSIPVPKDDTNSTITRLRSEQFNFNTTRITINLKKDISCYVTSAIQANPLRVALGNATTNLEAGNLPRLMPTQPTASPSEPTAISETGARITSIQLSQINPSLTQVRIGTTGSTTYRTEMLQSPNRLAFDLAEASLDPNANQTLAGDGTIIKSVRAGIFHLANAQFGRVVVDLTQLIGYTISSEPGENGAMTYVINLQTPTPMSASLPSTGAGNRLVGKIIMIDPGHGAEDSGAVAPDGTYEKTLTLAIGKKLRDTLIQDGATVFMTRDQDIKPSIAARPQMAIAHHADFFVSIHCDESGSHNAHTGTTVYFHAQNTIGRHMAADIINRICEVSGIPSAGIKSDTIRFQSGFGVLRGSPMPAVLVECGYMNNDQDLKKLKDENTQQKIAEGIAAGLRDFIADTH